MTKPTRERIYHLAREGAAAAEIARLIKRAKSTVHYHLDNLVNQGVLCRVKGGPPVLYRATGKAVRKQDHWDGWGDSGTRSHHTSRKFPAKAPPTRLEAIQWDRLWEASGVRFYAIRDKSIPTEEGSVPVKEIRISVGPKIQSIQVHLDHEVLTSPGDLETYEARATHKAILVAKWLASTIGMPTIILPSANKESHHAIRGVFIDNSEGALELETKNPDVAIVLMDPRALIREEATRLLIEEGLISIRPIKVHKFKDRK